MKKLVVCIMASLMLFAFTPIQLKAVEKSKIATEATTVNVRNAKIDEMLLRLDEINEMDKTELKSAEKRELRKEVRSIKIEIKHLGGGIYISASAAIIIIILLIILL